MSRIITSLVALVVLLSTTPVFAQEAIPEEFLPPVPGAVTSDPTGPLSCFDYYTFGSVQADLQPSIEQTTPGTALTFSGQITNDNPYPLTDGTLYAKIFKRDDDTFAAGDGNEVVDQFIIKEELSLTANGSVDHSFDWTVPINAAGGEYYAAYFFTTSQRYNLMGLSFTDDVVGNTAPFTITTDNPAIAKLSKTDTTLNDRNHHFAAFPLHFTAGEAVVVSTTITNPTDQPKTMPLQWNQYAWDAMNEDNLRNSKTELVTLEPNETKTVTYAVTPQAESVTYLTAVTQDNEAKSILDIRFVRDDIEETRINFPSVTSFPLAAGTETTLFACAHSTNQPIVPDNILTLTLTDKNNNVIHQYQYQGDIAGAMSGFGDTFTPDKNINYALLTATLERHGVTVEKVQVTYDCQDIDPSSCLPEPDTTATTFIDTIMQNPLISFLAVALLLTLLLVLFVHRRHNMGPHITAPSTTTPLSILFLLLLLPAVFLLSTHSAEAKSVSWSWSSSQLLEFCWNWGDYTPGSSCDGWAPALGNPNVTVSYAADIYNLDTGTLLSDGATVLVGTKFRIVPKSYENTDISWFGTGYANDSPNGHWISNADVPYTVHMKTKFGWKDYPVGSDCSAYDYSGTSGKDSFHTLITSYTPLSVNPPANSVNVGGTASLADLGGNVYQVNSPGTISAQTIFNATYGKFYYGYYYKGGCRSNDTALSLSKSQTNPFQLSIPARTITFNLNAVTANAAPNAPTIIGPTTALVNEIISLTTNATDPDGDTIRYGLDWDNNGTIDQYRPSSGYVNSGTLQASSRSWSTPGTYTVRARTQDSKGSYSGWSTHTVTVSAVPPPTANLQINGNDGPLNVPRGTALSLQWTSANAASCSKWGGTWGSGQSIPLNGSANFAITATTTYSVNCGGFVDSVTVNVYNQIPSPPTITGPGTVNQNQATTYSITGTDPDNDNIFYQIDWNNDGVPEANTITVPSGTSQPANRTWTTPGTYTFQARTVDISGAQSAWTQKTVTVNLVPPSSPPPSITGSCPVPGNSMTLSWPAAANATSYNLRVDNQTQSGWDGSCTGTGDTCQDGITGTTITLPGTPASTYNAWVHACNAAGCSGAVAVNPTFTCVERANLVPIRAASTPGATIDPVTGNYQTVTLTFDIANMGGVNVTQPFNYQLDIDYGADGSYVNNVKSGTINTTITAYDSNGARTTVPVSNFPLGPFTLRVIADTPGNGSIVESNEADNTNTFNFTVLPPDPTLTLTADRTQVRQGDSTNLNWSVGTVYPMSCTITGPGLSVPAFDPSTGPSSGVVPTPAISAKSEYTFTCTEPVTSSTFSTTVIVESVGEVQEI